MSTVGMRIEGKRKDLGLTQEELGKLVGESKQTIYKYEKGTVTNIPLEKVERIAAALHVTPSYLVGWDESFDREESVRQYDPAIPDPKDCGTISEDARQVAEAYDRLETVKEKNMIRSALGLPSLPADDELSKIG